MAGNTQIEWTDATWNPVTGCTKVSPGCKHCYAERLAARLKKMANPRYANGFSVTLHRDQIDLPLRWKNPRMIFVNSMSDLFHESIPKQFIKDVFHTMKRARRHVFQVLTKRSKRLLELSGELNWSPNIWQGVSVESADYLWRIEDLARTPANLKFLSLEPLLGPIECLPLDGIDWVIVGGESGPSHRRIESQWVREIMLQCSAAGVPFFFKQWGGRTPKSGGRLLDNREWNAMPIVSLAQSGPTDPNGTQTEI